MSKALILVSNDDGYRAAGIAALADALETDFEVWVVAPERERSAVSHAISLHKPLRVGEYGERRFWCSGTPADCVYIAVNHLLPRLPDLVISGMNHGANLGDDVNYSGTVAAAREGTLTGISSIATSVAAGARMLETMPTAAQYIRQLAHKVLAEGLPDRTLVNVNFPADWTDDSGIEVTRLGARNYGRAVQKKLDPRGKAYYWIGSGEIGFEPLEGSDCDAIAAGKAAITAVHLNFTEVSMQGTLERWVTE